MQTVSNNANKGEVAITHSFMFMYFCVWFS